MKRKILTTTLLALAGISFFTGCSKESSEKALEKEKTTEISFMIPDWGVPSQAMLDEFQNESGIKVNIETVSWDDIRNKIAIAANGKKAAADVFEVDWSWVGEFDSANWLEPLNLTQEDMNDIPSLSTFIVNGKTLAVPYANDFRIAYYNKDLYKSANLEEPQTWDDVTKNMETLKENNYLISVILFPIGVDIQNVTT